MGIPWVVPPHNNSRHQDYYIFSRGSQPKPSFTTGILGGGTTQGIPVCSAVNRSIVFNHHNMDDFNLLRWPFICVLFGSWYPKFLTHKKTVYFLTSFPDSGFLVISQKQLQDWHENFVGPCEVPLRLVVFSRYIYPGSPGRLLIQWSFRKDHCFTRDLHQQFQGTIILMVFDLQGIGKFTSQVVFSPDFWSIKGMMNYDPFFPDHLVIMLCSHSFLPQNLGFVPFWGGPTVNSYPRYDDDNLPAEWWDFQLFLGMGILNK